jgi:hypothetical protein
MPRMKQLAFVAAALLGAACGGKQGGGTIGSRGGAPRGPVLVFVGLGPTMMFEGACHAPPGGPDCDALRAAAMDGKQQVTADGATFRITGTVSDECDASGATDVVGLEKVSGKEDVDPGVLTYPAGAAIDLESYAADGLAGGGDQETSPGMQVADNVSAALARVATADLAAGDHARSVDPSEIVVEQVVTTNVDGDPRPDVVIAANVPMGSDDGPGYEWSALVVVPDGDYARAASAWTSDLEHMTIDASFDLEGDGQRELVYSAEYYEGGGHGVATVKDGKLEFLGQWGCGA